MDHKHRFHAPTEIVKRYWPTGSVFCVCVPWKDNTLMIMPQERWERATGETAADRVLCGLLGKCGTPVYLQAGTAQRIVIPRAFREHLGISPGGGAVWVDGGNHLLLYRDDVFQKTLSAEILRLG